MMHLNEKTKDNKQNQKKIKRTKIKQMGRYESKLTKAKREKQPEQIFKAQSPAQIHFSLAH